MNRYYLYISLLLASNSLEAAVAATIYYYYIVLHTNPIQCIWIRHLILSSEATAVCTEEDGKQIRLYIELLQGGGGKRVRLFIELLHGAGGKLSPTFVY